MLVKEELGLNNLIIYQDTELYRFTSDAIILSKFAKAKVNDKVADFCSGSGIVGIHFYALNADLVKSVDLFEMQTPLYDLSVKSVQENLLSHKIFPNNVKIQDIPKEYNGKFSLVLCNPPYMKAEGGFLNKSDSRAVCKAELTINFAEIAEVAERVLKFGGRFAFVNRADRLAEMFYKLKQLKLEPKKLQMVTGTDGKTPYLVLIEAVKGGKEGLNVLPNLVNGE